MEQKCALEQQILRNALSLASVAPDEMAFRIMKGPGYTAVTTGEVIHDYTGTNSSNAERLVWQEIDTTFENRIMTGAVINFKHLLRPEDSTISSFQGRLIG